MLNEDRAVGRERTEVPVLDGAGTAGRNVWAVVQCAGAAWCGRVASEREHRLGVCEGCDRDEEGKGG